MTVTDWLRWTTIIDAQHRGALEPARSTSATITPIAGLLIVLVLAPPVPL